MPTSFETDTKLDVSVPGHLKQMLEEAASRLGQTIDQFAVSTLTRAAQEVIQQHDRTELSNRDRDIFLALLDDVDAQPNAVLREAAQQYNRQVK